jgi:hypothetical protein
MAFKDIKRNPALFVIARMFALAKKKLPPYVCRTLRAPLLFIVEVIPSTMLRPHERTPRY